ncbi:MAG TPA: peptide-methionine (S)-S-oxide reductase MsrA [Pseudobdellovibrionaceae bacterium]|nr:peptide-methionine (S)-S-oxide reductase MsrA [Pseudobdellovibrionaceae bacterium]
MEIPPVHRQFLKKLCFIPLLFFGLSVAEGKPVVSKKENVMTAKTEIATLAGGCFWGVEELFRKEPGVIRTEVGYTGGTTDNAVYNLVKTGVTGHAESIQVEFDPSKTSFEKILLFFFKMHDPTTSNRQGNDVGTQYRSAIFHHDDEQKRIAEQVIERVNESGAWKRPVVTEVVPFKKWWKAEDFHQDYLQKNPGGYTCHFIRKVDF